MGFVQELKAAADLAKQLGAIEAQQALIDVQQQAIDLIEENRQLKTDNAELKQQRRTKEALRFRNNFYWLAKDDSEDGPYCSGCYDTQGQQLVRLHEFGRHFGCLGCGIVRTRDGEPEPNHAVLKRFNTDRAMGRPSGGRR